MIREREIIEKDLKVATLKVIEEGGEIERRRSDPKEEELEVPNWRVEEGGGDTRGGKLHFLLSSLFSSLGGVFGLKQEPESEMGSRPIVPKMAHGGGVGWPVAAGIGKPKAGIEAEENHISRRVLRDIGNRVTTRGDPWVAKAKVPDNSKKQVAAVIDGAGKDGDAGKAAHKKLVTLKPKPEMITEISPDTSEGKAAENKSKPEMMIIEISPDTGSSQRESSKEGSTSLRRKKKAHSLTSVLTARSKVACGLSYNKPKEISNVVDIDATDKNNELAAVEYVEDLYKYYKLAESWSQVDDYMDSQPEINEKMRAILIDWLIEVHNKFELMPETLYLTVHIVDQYLSRKSVAKKALQLVGISSMLIASKYEEIWSPEVNDFVCIADRTYTGVEIREMEKSILGKLEWNLTVPTPYVFLARYIKAAALAFVSDPQLENMAYFLAELGLMHYEVIKYYCPSMLAASAVYAARCTLNRSPFWTQTLSFHTGFSHSHLLDCAKQLVSFHSALAEDKQLQGLGRIYSKPQRGAVALLPPAKNLLEL